MSTVDRETVAFRVITRFGRVTGRLTDFLHGDRVRRLAQQTAVETDNTARPSSPSLHVCHKSSLSHICELVQILTNFSLMVIITMHKKTKM